MDIKEYGDTEWTELMWFRNGPRSRLLLTRD